MSFSELLKSNYKPREKNITISLNGKDIVFKAVEMSAAARLGISVARSSGSDWVSELIVASIIDPDGKHMTLEQAKALEEEYATKFFLAASEVNFVGEETKN